MLSMDGFGSALLNQGVDQGVVLGGFNGKVSGFGQPRKALVGSKVPRDAIQP